MRLKRSLAKSAFENRENPSVVLWATCFEKQVALTKSKIALAKNGHSKQEWVEDLKKKTDVFKWFIWLISLHFDLLLSAV